MTERNYFEAIRKFGHLPSTHVKVMPSKKGTSPQQVVESAYEYCEENINVDIVYCVFDRDKHPSFNDAIKIAEEKNGKPKNNQETEIKFFPISSDPCFELWFFLHYKMHRSAIEGNDLITKLKKLMPGGYEKNDPCHFEKTREHLNEAYENASKIKGNRDGSRVTNSYTDVDVVVKKLMELAARRKEFLKSIRG